MKVKNNMLKYKGFSGIVAYSTADGYYFGRILEIANIVTFKGKNEHSLKLAFFDAVDSYLFLNNGASMPTGRDSA